MPLTDGEVIAGYTISRRLGAGGMGEVYLAKHPRLPRYDALKVLSAAVTADDEYRQRFNREADIAATLWHPHIVQVHDRGEFDGRLWISMDHVEGTDAAALLAQRYPDVVPRVLHRGLGHEAGPGRGARLSGVGEHRPHASDHAALVVEFPGL